MGTADKMFSNVDKKTGEILKEAKLLLDPIGFTVSRVKEKKGPAIAAELMNGAYGKAAAQMIKDKVPDLTVRKICLKAIKDKTFDTCLDTLFTGPNKRAAFDNQSPKTWTKDTVTADIETKGQFKRFKLIERYIKLDMNATRTLLDPDYRPASDKVVVKKRKYKKKK
jgi:hypothetical protein